jgi:hypothetical protein
MIGPLTITNLNQGKLYGEKPTIEALCTHGAVVHERELGSLRRKLLARKLLAWRVLFAPSARTVRG